MVWVEKTFEKVSNRKRKSGQIYKDSELKEERDEVIEDYETLAKRLQYEKPSYIELTDRVAKRIAKDILYHETIMEHFMDQPAYKFIMNVASFTNDDVSKFWSDHIKTNKPAPYELGNDIREMAVRIARERADQDVHQWCKILPATARRGEGFDIKPPRTPIKPKKGGPSPQPSPKKTGPGSPNLVELNKELLNTANKYGIERIVSSPSSGSPRQGQSSPRLPIGSPPPPPPRVDLLFEYALQSQEKFIKWLKDTYIRLISLNGNPNYDSTNVNIREKLRQSLVVEDPNYYNNPDFFYDLSWIRFTKPPNDSKGTNNRNRYRAPNYKEFCHEDPCGYEYIDLVQPYYKRRFDFHIHDYLKNHYEEKMAYEIQKWYNSSPESIKKIFFAPVIYGHMNEVTFALTHRYPKFKNCEAVDFYHSDKHRLLFSKCVALAVRGSQVLSGKKYGLDKSFMRINLEKRRAMHAWKHMERPKKASRPVSTRSDEILRNFNMARR